MKSIVVSDRLLASAAPYDMQVVGFESRPSVEGFPVVILDLYFGEALESGSFPLGRRRFNFHELGTEVFRCVDAGGVVIAMLGPVAVTERSLQSQAYMRGTLEAKQRRESTGNGTPPVYESSYDWLDQGFLTVTQIDRLYCRSNEGISFLLPNSQFFQLRSATSRYWVSIDGIDRTPKKQGAVVTHRIEEPSRWSVDSSVAQYKARILAEGAHTHRPVAVALNYMNLPGLLALMPPLMFQQSQSVGILQRMALTELVELAEYLKEHVMPETQAVHPEWALSHRAPQANTISRKLGEFQEQVKELERQLGAFDKMLYLLDGTGSPLVDAVAQLFDKPEEGIRVKKTEAGASLDMFVHNGQDRSLAIEVTGVRGALKKDDPHWADFLEYLPEHNSNNVESRRERIVLVVNTQRDNEIEKRLRNQDITLPVKKLAEDNHICVIRSADLYTLWLRTLEGVPTARVFEILFNTEGIYDPVKNSLIVS